MPYALANDPGFAANSPLLTANGYYAGPPPDPSDAPPEYSSIAAIPGVGLTDRSVRLARFAYDLLDRGHHRIGELHPNRDSAPDVTLSIGGVNRAARGFQLPVSEAGDIDPSSHRIAPWWVDADGTRYPLGVYVLGDVEEEPYSGGTLIELTLADESALTDEPINRSLSWPRGFSVAQAIDVVVGHLAFPKVEVDPTLATLAEPVSFSVADVDWREVCAVLAKAAGMLSPYFTNAGVWRWRVAPDWSTAPPEHVYGPGQAHYLRRGHQVGMQLLGLPNVWYAIDSGAGGAEVMARYRLPDAAPNSIARLGRERPAQVSISGLEAGETALDAARAAAAESLDSTGPATLEAPFDPRHDLYELIEVDGYRYRDVGGAFSLQAGTTMRRNLRRIWTDDDPIGTVLGGLLP